MTITSATAGLGLALGMTVRSDSHLSANPHSTTPRQMNAEGFEPAIIDGMSGTAGAVFTASVPIAGTTLVVESMTQLTGFLALGTIVDGKNVSSMTQIVDMADISPCMFTYNVFANGNVLTVTSIESGRLIAGQV